MIWCYLICFIFYVKGSVFVFFSGKYFINNVDYIRNVIDKVFYYLIWGFCDFFYGERIFVYYLKYGFLVLAFF